MKLHRIATVLATLFICAFAHAQNQPYDPGVLYDSNTNQIGAGAPTWIFDLDSSGRLIDYSDKQIASGDTLVVAPRILDSFGHPRNWPTNTQFALCYQSGVNMTKSNMWWMDTNLSTFPVYKTGGIIDTGRVAMIFNATNYFGASSYNCFVVAYVTAGLLSQPGKFTLNVLNAPGLDSSIAPQPIYWTTLVSNIVNSAVSQIASNYTRVTTNGAFPGYFFLQTSGH